MNYKLTANLIATITVAACIDMILGCKTLQAQVPTPLRIVWEDSATDISGHVSRDGKWLSYTDWNTGDLNIREIATGKNLRITNGPGDLTEFAGTSVFSPQSDRIAFVWFREPTEIRVAPLMNDQSHLVISNASLLDWSPDGERLLVTNEGQMGYVQVKTGEFRSILNVPDGIINARVSPNGELVAFTTLGADPTQYEIQIVTVRSGERQKFVSGWGSHQAPVWSVDGKSIIYLSDRGSKPQVWRKSLNDRDPKKGGQAIADLPDAAVVMLGVDSKGTFYLGTYDRGGQDVYIGVVDWAQNSVDDLIKIPSPPFHGSRRGVFSPSANKIAYMRKGRGHIVRPGWQMPIVRDLATGVERVYPTQLTLRDEPLWTKNETSLYFAAPQERTIGEGADRKWPFYSLDLNKGNYTQVGQTEVAGTVRMVSAPADSIVYFVNSFGKVTTASIFSMDVSSGRSVLLYRIENNSLADAALSPDGARLALVMGNADGSKGLYILQRGQTTPTPLTTIRTNARAQLIWLSSGSAVVTSGRIKGKQGIWRVPVDGAPPQALNIPAADVTEVRLSADGRKIAFTRTNQLPRQILALDNR